MARCWVPSPLVSLSGSALTGPICGLQTEGLEQFPSCGPATVASWAHSRSGWSRTGWRSMERTFGCRVPLRSSSCAPETALWRALGPSPTPPVWPSTGQTFGWRVTASTRSASCKAQLSGGRRFMKPIVIGMSMILAVFAAASFIAGQTPAASSPEQPAGNGAPPLSNPLKVALLEWYPANQVPTYFSVGQSPDGVAFDGANIWTANNGDGTVTKLRSSDGAALGRFSVGGRPSGVCFDGADIWVSDNFGSSVTKLRASDGQVLGKFTVGHQPYWMAFDGGSIWIANGGDGTVTKLRASDGKNLGTFNTGGSVAVAFDGRYVWVTTYHQSVVRLNQDGSSAGTFQVGHNPVGVALDGVDIWVANTNDGTVTKLRASDGTTLSTFRTPGSPYGIAFDGQDIWVTLPESAGAAQMRPSDGAILYTPGVIGPATGIAFDGANIWTGNGIGSTTASKL